MNERAVVIFSCLRCNVELFRAHILGVTTFNQSFCLLCSGILVEKARMYDDLCK